MLISLPTLFATLSSILRSRAGLDLENFANLFEEVQVISDHYWMRQMGA